MIQRYHICVEILAIELGKMLLLMEFVSRYKIRERESARERERLCGNVVGVVLVTERSEIGDNIN